MAFLIIVFTLVVLTSWMVFSVLIAPAASLLPWLYPLHAALYGLAAIVIGIVFYTRAKARVRHESPVHQWISRYFFVFIGVHSLLIPATLVQMLVHVLSGADQAQLALATLAGAYAVAAASVLTAKIGPRLQRVKLAGSGPVLKIAQISDLHIGVNIGPRYVKKVVELANAGQPDCIVLTGDIGDGDSRAHQAAIAELAQLRAPLGVFLILGNHELYWQAGEWIKAFRAAGLQVLVDEARDLHWQGRPFTLLGLAPSASKPMAEQLAMHPATGPVLVLSHYPSRAQEAAAAGAKLFLAGHTHGGQYWPWSWLIYLFHRYAKGYYQLGAMQIYINRGTGYWGPPLRLGARAEVSLLEWPLG